LGGVENLQCLKDVSGWDVLKVDGRDVKMAFKGDLIVSFHVDKLSRGERAKVEIPGNLDPVQQFTYSAFTPSILKGDIQTVYNPFLPSL